MSHSEVLINGTMMATEKNILLTSTLFLGNIRVTEIAKECSNVSIGLTSRIIDNFRPLTIMVSKIKRVKNTIAIIALNLYKHSSVLKKKQSFKTVII